MTAIYVQKYSTLNSGKISGTVLVWKEGFKIQTSEITLMALFQEKLFIQMIKRLRILCAYTTRF